MPFLNRFGSVRVNRFLHYKTENRTEPRFFLTILIGLIGFFFGSVFSVNFFSVFSVYSVFRFFCTPLTHCGSLPFSPSFSSCSSLLDDFSMSEVKYIWREKCVCVFGGVTMEAVMCTGVSV